VKTRFSSLVTIKKSTMDKSEQVLQKANADLNSANTALKISYDSLKDIETPLNGNASDLLAQRTLLSSQRGLINHNSEWVQFAIKQVKSAKEQLKLDMIEHEKFKYLELEDIKKVIKKQKIQEAKELDEVALMTYGQKEK
jgi:flagellar biosynthesis chaperone FliJ